MPRPFRLSAPVPSENDVEKGCLQILSYHHYWVARLNAGLFRSWDMKRVIPGVPKGTPDYVCCHERFRNFLLEVKRPGGQLSGDQEFQIAMIRQQFGLTIAVVESVEQLSAWLAIHERSP